MNAGSLHPLAEDYLRRLRQAGRRLPPERLGELLADIEGHLADAIPPDASDDEALEVLERLGPPGEIIEAEQPSASGPADRRGWREWAAVILLPLGGFAFGVGWLVGLDPAVELPAMDDSRQTDRDADRSRRDRDRAASRGADGHHSAL